MHFPSLNAIGSLIYVMLLTRLDISFVVGFSDKYVGSLAIKRVMRYLKGSSNLVLCYSGSDK